MRGVSWTLIFLSVVSGSMGCTGGLERRVSALERENRALAVRVRQLEDSEDDHDEALAGVESRLAVLSRSLETMHSEILDSLNKALVPSSSRVRMMSSKGEGDVCWVLFQRIAVGAPGKNGEGLSVRPRYTLACYAPGRDGKKMRLVSVREITYDLDLVEFRNAPPRIRDILRRLPDAQKRKR